MNGYRLPEYEDSEVSTKSDVFFFEVVSNMMVGLVYIVTVQIDKQVVTECFTGLLAYSLERDTRNLVSVTLFSILYTLHVYIHVQADHMLKMNFVIQKHLHDWLIKSLLANFVL